MRFAIPPYAAPLFRIKVRKHLTQSVAEIEHRHKIVIFAQETPLKTAR